MPTLHAIEAGAHSISRVIVAALLNLCGPLSFQAKTRAVWSGMRDMRRRASTAHNGPRAVMDGDGTLDTDCFQAHALRSRHTPRHPLILSSILTR